MSRCFRIGISIAIIIALVAAFSGCDEAPVVAGSSTAPASADTSGATDAGETSAFATDSAQPGGTEPSDTSQPGDTATAPPDGSAQPDNSASAAPTGTQGATASPAPTATPANAGTLSIDPVVGKAKVTEHLTLRSKASSDGESLAEIPKDGEFTILQVETGKKWLKVEYEDKTGYVPFKYVTVGDKATDLVCTVFCNSVLNVREGAGTSKKVVGSVGSGTTLIVKGKTSVSGKTWYKVDIGSSTGYVVASYCRISEK